MNGDAGLAEIGDATDDFRTAVLAGLTAPRKSIPARFFYDSRGSELFDRITRLPEYYPTRVETELLRAHRDDLERLAGEGWPVVEFGAGSLTKTPLLLEALGTPLYVPVDIAADFLDDAVDALRRAHPRIKVLPVAADFTKPFRMPAMPGPVTGFFSGSTIGNFPPAPAVDLLRHFRAVLGRDARMVIGIDTRKNPRLLEAAYDDAAGVTAAFNLNLLHRINRELQGTIPVDAFEHRVWWHDGLGRIEMHLLAARDVHFSIAGRPFELRAGETIHTENSYKYTSDEARFMARAAGWEPLAAWADPDKLFSLHVWTAAETLEP